MRADFVNPFLQAADEVLESELGSAPSRGALSMRKSAYTTAQVTALVTVSGAVSGSVLFSMADATARAIVGHLMQAPCLVLDAVAQSGIAELGNVITGRAATLLAESGFPSLLLPPRIILGTGVLVSNVDQQRLVIPLETSVGLVEIQVSLN